MAFRGLILALLVFTAVELTARAENHALVVGGGCETSSPGNTTSGEFGDTSGASKGHYNLFRPEVELAHKSLTANGWKTNVQYDADQWEKPWPGATGFTKKSIIAALEAEISKADPDKPDQQFLLAIATHGSPDPHHICLGDGKLMPISDLYPYLKKLKKKGVKIGVLDGSCYSGNTPDEFEGLGICTMSSTNPNTTGGGDGVWAGVLGLGLPKDTKPPSFYTGKLPNASADLNGDDRLSAGEAFQFARLHSPDFMIPRTSDCKLQARDVGKFLAGAVPMLRSESGLEQESGPWQKAHVTDTQLCSMNDAASSFKKLFDGLDPTQKVLFNAELIVLGYPVSSSIFTLNKNLKKNVDALQLKLISARQDQDLADAAMAKGSAVPKDVTERLEKLGSESREAKKAIFADLRPLVHLACMLERRNPNLPPKLPCEKFDLFPKRAGT